MDQAVGVQGWLAQEDDPFCDPGSPMPFKANADHHHHIPKQRHRVTNWAEYDAALRARGSLTVWFTPEAVAVWAAAPRHLVAWIGRLASGAGRYRTTAPFPDAWISAVPFKATAACRHHIPKQRHRVTNWAAYDAGLCARGSLTVWFTPEAVAAWAAAPRTSRGGQPSYSDLAIATTLTLRAVFRLALRQTEGLIGSILQLLDLDLPVPDHSTLSRRAETLEVPRPKTGSAPVHLLVDSTGLKLCSPGEWLMEKHGAKRRRAWRVLHLATDADTGRIVASVLTDKDADDGSQVGPLLDQVDGPVASVTGDGAYDRDDVYAAVAARSL